MTIVQSTIAVIVGLAALATLAFGAWQLVRGADREATIKRLRAETADYLQRLNYIEPKHRALEQQVDFLIALHNPGEKLDDIIQYLRGIKALAEQIDRRLYEPRGENHRD